MRARVQMRAADALWESDSEKGRALFRRAWEAADAADKEAWRRYAEERQRIASSSEPNRHLQSPPELRNEVMRLIAKRDRALAEEFLAQLTDDTARDTANPAVNSASPATADPENPPLRSRATSATRDAAIKRRRSRARTPVCRSGAGSSHNPRHLVPLLSARERHGCCGPTFCVDAGEDSRRSDLGCGGRLRAFVLCIYAVPLHHRQRQRPEPLQSIARADCSTGKLSTRAAPQFSGRRRANTLTTAATSRSGPHDCRAQGFVFHDCQAAAPLRTIRARGGAGTACATFVTRCRHS